MSGFLAGVRNDTKEMLGMTARVCHAERSEASMSGFLAGARNDTKEMLGMTARFVMLSEAKHP